MFRISTGSRTGELSPAFKVIALRLARDLKSERELGRVTSEKPATAKRICDGYFDQYKERLLDSQIRAMVHWLRTVKKMPIGSWTRGYYWAMNEKELDRTLGHLTSRSREIEQDLRDLKRMRFDADPQTEMFESGGVAETSEVGPAGVSGQ